MPNSTGYQTAGELQGCAPDTCSIATSNIVAPREETLFATTDDIKRGNESCSGYNVINFSGWRFLLDVDGCA